VTRRLLRNVGVPLLSIALLLGLWQAIVVLFHVQSYVAPRPWPAILSVTQNWSLLWPLILGTIRETVYGFAIGALLGAGFGIVMAKVPVFQGLIYPVLILSQAVPIVALGPVLVLILGFGIVPKLVIVAWIVFFPVTVNVLDGLSHVDQDLLNLARVYRASRWRTFVHIEMPATASQLFSGLKIGATYAVTGAILGELAASEGVSLAIYQAHANSNYNTAAVYGTTMVMTVIGIAWFLLMFGIEIWATPWQRRTVARRPWWRRDRSRVPGLDSTPPRPEGES
jgi:ABC-type nitrate/sulfonate/bicarbonate transport system permease component